MKTTVWRTAFVHGRAAVRLAYISLPLWLAGCSYVDAMLARTALDRCSTSTIALRPSSAASRCRLARAMLSGEGVSGLLLAMSFLILVEWI